MLEHENENNVTPAEQEHNNTAPAPVQNTAEATAGNATGNTAEPAPAPEPAPTQEPVAAQTPAQEPAAQNTAENGAETAPVQCNAPLIPQAVPVAPVPGAMTAASAPVGPVLSAAKKSRKPLILGVAAVAVVAVVAIVVVAVMRMSAPPQKALLLAMQNTLADQKQLMERVRADIPMLGGVAQGTPARFDYEITFEGMDGPNNIAVDASLLRGTALHGFYTNVPDKQAEEMELGLRFGTADVVSMYAYASTETLMFGIPTYSDVMLAVHPDELVNEITASPFAQYFSEPALASLQQQVQSSARLGRFDTLAINDEMTARLTDIVKENAPNMLIEKSGDDTYLITVPAEETKAVLLEAMRYFAQESALKEMYGAAFAQLTGGGMDYAVAVEQSLAMMERDMTPQPMEATVRVKGGKVESIEASVKTPDAPNKEFDVVNLSASCNFQAGIGSLVELSLSLMQNGKTVQYVVSKEGIQDSDKSYLEKVSIDLLAEMTALGLDYSTDYRPDGGVTQSLGMESALKGKTNFAAGIDMEGTVKAGKDDTLLRYEFPQISINFQTEDAQRYTARIIANAQASKVGADYEPTREPTFVAQMTKEQANKWIQDFTDGILNIQTLVQDAIS